MPNSFIIIYGLAATIIVPSVVGIVRFRNLHSSHKAIASLFAIGLLNEVVMVTLSLQRINNLFTIHFYALVEIILLSLYFYYLIVNPAVRRFIVIGITALSTFAIVYAINGNNIAQFNSFPRAIECVYFTFLSIWLFYEMADYLKAIDPSDYFINGATFFYFSSCFIIFAFNNYVSLTQDDVLTMVFAHSYINAFCNIVYAIGLWRASKQSYSQV